jgi:spermidine synthase
MYHVIAIGLTATLLYVISYFLFRIGYYSLLVHRKLWNTILATVFLITALAGLFLALQVSYKWNIPFIKTVLKYHVEFGIGMAFAGLFHTAWHLSYFTGTPVAVKKGSDTSLPKLTQGRITINLFILGLVSTSIQLLLIREMMNISGGYELVAGTFLCSWLIISALGSSIAGKSGFTEIKKLNLVFSLSPLVSIAFLLLFSELILGTGETPSFLMSILYTFLVLLPFCLISGFTFIKLTAIAAGDSQFVPGKSFSLETTGGIAAGILISSLTSGILNTWQLLLLILVISNSYVLITWFISGRLIKISALAAAILLSILICSTNPDRIFRQVLLGGIEITDTKDTPYGNITSAVYNGEVSKFYNQRLLDYRNDVIEREENVHYAMLQSLAPARVTVISGSPESYLPEIMKYKVEEIISIERDPALSARYLNKEFPFSEKLRIINDDAFRYITRQNQKSDVILLLAPPPSTLLLNRFYTTDFFSEIKQNLTEGGVFMCSPGSYDNYMNNESIKLCSSVFNSLSQEFKCVLPIAGNKLFFIASDKELSSSICRLAETGKIENSYVNSDFLADDLIKAKSDEILSLMNLSIRQNKLTFPLACFYFQSYNLTKNLNEKTPAIIILVLLFALPVIFITRRNRVMYFTASALAGFEIIILAVLQLTLGNMYQFTGLVMAALMAGLAAGSGFSLKFLPIRTKGLILFILYLLSGLCLNYVIILRSTPLVMALLLIASFIPAFFTGNMFRDLTQADNQMKGPAATYAADLTGSAFGLMSVSAICIPAFGIKGSLFLLSLLIFTGFLFGTVKNK